MREMRSLYRTVRVSCHWKRFMINGLDWIYHLSPLSLSLCHLSTCPYLVINQLSVTTVILPFGHCTPHSALEHKSTGAVDNWCAIAGGSLDADNRADSFNALM